MFFFFYFLLYSCFFSVISCFYPLVTFFSFFRLSLVAFLSFFFFFFMQYCIHFWDVAIVGIFSLHIFLLDKLFCRYTFILLMFQPLGHVQSVSRLLYYILLRYSRKIKRNAGFSYVTQYMINKNESTIID